MIRLVIVSIASLAVLWAFPAASAQFAETKDEIVEKLKGDGALRQKGAERGLSVGRSTAGAAAASAAPSVQLKVEFEFGSAALTPSARQILDTLAEALVTDDLRNDRFLLTGHTDAVGSEGFNEQLSRNRAISAREYLVNRHSIPRARLEAIGVGEKRPLLPGDPENASNRRVEITKLSSE